MAPIGTLWGSSIQRQTKVILSVAALNDLELKLEEIKLPTKPADFVTKFPYTKIPAFEDSDGWKLSEGAAIALYLSKIGQKAQLLGTNAKESARVEQWVHFAEHEIGGPAQRALQTVFCLSGPFTGTFNREILDKQIAILTRALTYLESHLETCASGYVALDTLSLADLVLAGVVFHARRSSLGNAEAAKYPNVFAHFAKVTGDERIKQLWGAGRWPFVDVAITEARPFPTS